MKSEVASKHTAKLRAMTSDYGAASGPANNIKSPQEALKGNGPEEHVGFGADSSKASARSDKPARRSQAANPVATYANGGKVPMPRPRPEGKEPGAEDLYSPADSKRLSEQRAMGGVIARARGGRAKGATTVNVVIQPPAPPAEPPMAPPPQLAGLVPPPQGGPPMPPPGGPPPMGPPPGGPGGPPQMPMRARGGRVKNSETDSDDRVIKTTLSEEGLIRKARGGGIHMTASAANGIGRLEKMGITARHRGSMAPKDV